MCCGFIYPNTHLLLIMSSGCALLSTCSLGDQGQPLWALVSYRLPHLGGWRCKAASWMFHEPHAKPHLTKELFQLRFWPCSPNLYIQLLLYLLAPKLTDVPQRERTEFLFKMNPFLVGSTFFMKWININTFFFVSDHGFKYTNWICCLRLYLCISIHLYGFISCDLQSFSEAGLLFMYCRKQTLLLHVPDLSVPPYCTTSSV